MNVSFVISSFRNTKIFINYIERLKLTKINETLENLKHVEVPKGTLVSSNSINISFIVSPFRNTEINCKLIIFKN